MNNVGNGYSQHQTLTQRTRTRNEKKNGGGGGKEKRENLKVQHGAENSQADGKYHTQTQPFTYSDLLIYIPRYSPSSESNPNP
jgi:hypothetical protein